MRLSAICAAALTLAGASPAAAERWVGAASTASVSAPSGDDRLAHFGSGGALSFFWIDSCRDSELCGGVEVSALFIRGSGEERLYDLGASMIGSFPLEEGRLAPFVSVGLDLAAVAVPDGEEIARGVGIGVHGNAGLHAMLSDAVYLRGQVGYIGAGIGGVKGELALGYQFGE